jgi:hypothetical protein
VFRRRPEPAVQPGPKLVTLNEHSQLGDHVGIGINNPDLTLEDVRDHFDEIRDETGYSVPSGVADEIASLVGRLR